MKSLKQFREKAGLSQFQLASAAGLASDNLIGLIENFRRNLSGRFAEKVAPVLGITADDLITQHTMNRVMVKMRELEAALKSDNGDKYQTKRVVLIFVKEYIIPKTEDTELPGVARKAMAKAAMTILKELDESKEAQENHNPFGCKKNRKN